VENIVVGALVFAQFIGLALVVCLFTRSISGVTAKVAVRNTINIILIIVLVGWCLYGLGILIGLMVLMGGPCC
jgi:hypothetical protein